MHQGLILVDIQNDYFRGGAMELHNMDEAATNCGKLLNHFRRQQAPIFHIQHIANREGATFFIADTAGCEINASVKPENNEPVIVKHFPNSFRETSLQEALQREGVNELLICGAMSHMCIDSTTRAAFDLGYKCTVAHDACASRDLVFQEHTIKAVDVHSAIMAALSAPFAKITSTTQFLAAEH